MAKADIKLIELDRDIYELIISQPDRRNAISLDMWKVFPEALAPLSSSKSLRALIIRGDGAHFSSGADISEFEQVFSNRQCAKELHEAMEATCHAIQNIPVPTIAKIKGVCFGGGCAVAMACDIRFADETAKFSIPPAKLGLVYPYTDMKRLVDLVGLSKAKELIFSASVLAAKKAESLGLINESYPSEHFDQTVQDYVKNIAEKSGYSQRQTKAIFNAIQTGVLIDSKASEDFFLNALDSSDFKEGFQAFLEKREPQF